ncbi:SDR family oxidoreductase [Tepidiforma sp.]|uniref:SDR family NAD(P)-dependent oxidoreductase n=1 Tax=Tepidiforma sp. TaxID=2682230 RepID=UPI002ADE800D|nr:SDR family oxidoreductase [Tepidiforma sp.]
MSSEPTTPAPPTTHPARRLAGKIAVVLGASSGLGRAAALRFASEGATVIAAARRLPALETLARECNAIPVPCDITRDDQVAALAQLALERYGTLDIALNTAGFEQSTPIRDLTPERLHAMASVQFLGAVSFIRHMANAMAASGGGSLITISSITARLVGEGLAAYGGSKAAIDHITRIAALEYGPHGVRVNVVSPGLIETPMTAHMFVPPVVRAFIRETPLRRMGTVDDVVEAITWLASDAASFITGHDLPVDGGQLTRRLPDRDDFLASR